jgi:hypothetical protein
VSKFSIGSKDETCITNNQKEEELEHQKHLRELVGTAPFNPKNPGCSTRRSSRISPGLLDGKEGNMA